MRINYKVNRIGYKVNHQQLKETTNSIEIFITDNFS